MWTSIAECSSNTNYRISIRNLLHSPAYNRLLSLIIIIPYLIFSLIIIPYYPISIRNLLHSPAYNPSTVAWVDETAGCFKVHFTDRQTE